jgi:peptidoglycan/xylan/chitin deacetylase (PgdA/CDA1 family)
MRRISRLLKVRIIIRRYEVILFGSVLLLSGAVMPSSWEPSIRRYSALRVESLEKTTVLPPHPWIALTFDDGPHPIMTQRLLAVLRQEHVPGTFFVVGKMVDRYPQLARAIVRDGHEIENHTYHHINLAHLPRQEVFDELKQTHDAILRLTGADSVLFRPPGGDFSRRTVRLASEVGYRMVLWSVQTNDVAGASPARIQQRILTRAEDGGIILMHSGVLRTVEILPAVIAQLRTRGYHFVTVATLLGLDHPASPGFRRHTPVLETVSAKLPAKGVPTQ